MNFEKIYLFNEDVRYKECFSQNDYINNFNENEKKGHILNFKDNKNLKFKDHIITILGYTNSKKKHTNWFPWNRFYDVFKTIGYKVEWVEIENLKRNNEKRVFITWNYPPCCELVQHKNYNKNTDIIFQKLTSLGKYDSNENWTNDPYNWYKSWKWTMYQMLENVYDNGYNIYGFGCKSIYNDFPHKKRICEKLKDRIFWISWGGTPFNLKNILECRPVFENLNKNCGFVGSKWGKVGRGNVDAWKKYLTPLEKHGFEYCGGIGKKMLTDEEMVKKLKNYKICPIIHAPSWVAEKGIQDRFYTVFICGRFGICDNLGAIDVIGDEIKDICTKNPAEYYNKTIHFLNNIEQQRKYIEIIQKKIKIQYNFYVQWYNVMCLKKNF